ncbi:hypothetical protein YB2330_006669 [Saitoella coloradoensis]
MSAPYYNPAPSTLADMPSPTLSEAAGQPIRKKSKAGRKPIYHTAEERRDRNRASQAAFRHRKNAYVANLERTVLQLAQIAEEYQREAKRANDQLAVLRSQRLLESTPISPVSNKDFDFDFGSDGVGNGHDTGDVHSGKWHLLRLTISFVRTLFTQGDTLCEEPENLNMDKNPEFGFDWHTDPFVPDPSV